MYIGGIAAVLPIVQQRRARPLAVSSGKRTALLPEVPTFIESGISGYELENWCAVVAPTGTPNAVIERLNSVLVLSLASADVRQRFSGLGTDAVSSTPEQLGAYHRQVLAKWARVIKAAGVQAQ